MFLGAFSSSMGAIMYDVSDAYVDFCLWALVGAQWVLLRRLLFIGAFRSSMGAGMYVVSDTYVESTLSRRLIVAVFIYWRRVHGFVD